MTGKSPVTFHLDATLVCIDDVGEVSTDVCACSIQLLHFVGVTNNLAVGATTVYVPPNSGLSYFKPLIDFYSLIFSLQTFLASLLVISMFPIFAGPLSLVILHCVHPSVNVFFIGI